MFDGSLDRLDGERRRTLDSRNGNVNNVTTNAEFAKRMMLLARPAERFRPTVTYDADGDCLEFLAKPDPFFGERIDDLVTVYYSQESGEVIGSLIKGVSRFVKGVLQKFPGFQIEICDGRIRLVQIFRARLWTSPVRPEDIATLTYRKLSDVAEQAEAEVDANELCLA